MGVWAELSDADRLRSTRFVLETLARTMASNEEARIGCTKLKGAERSRGIDGVMAGRGRRFGESGSRGVGVSRGNSLRRMAPC